MFRLARALLSVWAVAIGVASSAEVGGEIAAPCAACHGPNGNSANPEWPKLAGQHAAYMREQLTAYKSGERANAIMGPIAAGLTEEQFIELAEYFSMQTPRPGIAKSELVAAGAKIYRGGNAASGVPACMGCHGPRGSGNPPARYPALAGQHALYTSNQLKAYRDGNRSTDANAVMRTIAARLTDAEIEAVASYIEGLH